MRPTDQTLDLRLIGADETTPLRLLVLRPGRPREDAIYAQDKVDGAFHAGAFAGDELVGIVSFAPEAYAPTPYVPAVRFRGMAVKPALQKSGVGSALLLWALDHARGLGRYEVVWCHARTPAVSFYGRLGFERIGEEFQSDVGPHYLMVRAL
ncbi:MAG: GNAT family N-acetyltransferase [Dehalococcoidia bacterium]